MKIIILKTLIYCMISFGCILQITTTLSTSAKKAKPPYLHEQTQTTSDENPAVTRFREYLRFNSSQPDPDYDSCIEWLKKQSDEIGLEFHKIVFPPPALFTIRLTWQGTNPRLKSIMINSHIDVVSVDRSKWKYDPFSATKELNGNIFARGSQDIKVLGAQYLEAVRRLKSNGFIPLRTLHITYVPDEEAGGSKGMQPFIKSMDFKGLNIGMALDEGLPTAGDEYEIFYGARAIWQFKVTAIGKSSHAGIMFEDNAAVKLSKVINQLLKFRKKQFRKLKQNSTLGPGDVTSINLTQLGGGFQANVVPSEFWAIFDMRIKVSKYFTFDDATKLLDDICKKAGPGVSYTFIEKSTITAETRLDDSNVWWKTFKGVFDQKGLILLPKFYYAASDASYLREANYTAFGFEPLPKTEDLLHQDNEFLNENTFLNGIKMYEIIIPALTSVNSSFV